MNRREAWKYVAEGAPEYGNSEEAEECSEYSKQYWKARAIVRRSVLRKWWQIWL